MNCVSYSTVQNKGRKSLVLGVTDSQLYYIAQLQRDASVFNPFPTFQHLKLQVPFPLLNLVTLVELLQL